MGIFNQHITSAWCGDGRADQQRAGQTDTGPGAIAQHHRATAGSSDTDQSNFLVHQIQNVGAGQEHRTTDHVKRCRTGTQRIRAVDGDTRHTVHDQTIELVQVNAGVGRNGFGRHSADTGFDRVGTGADTRRAVEAHRIGSNVDTLRPGSIEPIGIGDSPAGIQTDHTCSSGARVELA